MALGNKKWLGVTVKGLGEAKKKGLRGDRKEARRRQKRGQIATKVSL
jgi:hypothetical protein